MARWFHDTLAQPFRDGVARGQAQQRAKHPTRSVVTTTPPDARRRAMHRQHADGRWFWRGFFTAAALHRWGRRGR